MFERLKKSNDVADASEQTQWSGLTVGLVGHCGPDTHGLTRFVNRVLPGARIESVHTGSELEALGAEGVVLLVNRVLDGRFETGNGVELIRQLRNRDADVVAILMSNFTDAQQDAEAAGAQPGFGKSQLKDDVSAARLCEAAQAAIV